MITPVILLLFSWLCWWKSLVLMRNKTAQLPPPCLPAYTPQGYVICCRQEKIWRSFWENVCNTFLKSPREPLLRHSTPPLAVDISWTHTYVKRLVWWAWGASSFPTEYLALSRDIDCHFTQEIHRKTLDKNNLQQHWKYIYDKSPFQIQTNLQNWRPTTDKTNNWKQYIRNWKHHENKGRKYISDRTI